MSNWTGGTRKGNPEASTDTRCTWQMCTIYVPRRFLDVGLLFCREHALLTWSLVNEQLADGETFEPEPAREAPLPISGIVYYIRTGGRIKIGHTVNIWRRLSQYPPDVEVLYLRWGVKQLERAEHLRFRAYLADGREWFQDRPEVTERIAEMAAGHEGWEQILDGDWWRRRKAPSVAIRRSGK